MGDSDLHSFSGFMPDSAASNRKNQKPVSSVNGVWQINTV